MQRGYDQQATPPVPRLRFDLLPEQSLDSTNLSTLERRDSEHVDDDSTKHTILPAIHASTARENSLLHPLDQTGKTAVQAMTARIRFAPPSMHQRPKFVKPSAHRPSPPSRLARYSRPNNQQARLASGAFDTDDGYTLMRQLIANKQSITVRCFRALQEIQKQCQSGSTKAILHQVHSVLYEAAYKRNQADGTDAPENKCAYGDSHLDEGQQGDQPYFALQVNAQEVLHKLSDEVSEVQTKIAMEESITSELNERLRQLDDDLEQLQLKHAQSTDNIEIERVAVNQLEQEYGMLLGQEHDMKHECEVLFSQVERQKVQVKDVRAKASYLEFISRVPMKKHLDEKKLRDQEEVLLSVARQAEDENAKLETELAKLDAQVAAIEQQYQQDFDKKSRLEAELRDVQDEYERIEMACRRTRDCHTPRPTWDDIIDQTPELSHQKYEWEILDDSISDYQPRQGSDSGNNSDFVDEDDDGAEVKAESNKKTKRAGDLSHLHSSESGKTKKLVKEMLHWIERLQKHCGVNLHLSRVGLRAASWSSSDLKLTMLYPRVRMPCSDLARH